ncbi:vanomycin resistance protein VanB [Chloroflexia bacterium SDU3-3]|nr:vanomycin resistance protein VanB [Chloroflexia bacterium SDU3-3]
MPQRYYQEYGPIRRRRADGGPEEPPERPERPRRPERPERPRRRRRSLLGPAALVLLVAAVVVAFPLAQHTFAVDRPAEGVTVQGLAAGGMSRAALQDALAERYAAFLAAPLTLEFEGQQWHPTLAQLGAKLDLEATARDAVDVGRRGGPVQQAQELWGLWSGRGIDLAPRLQVDTAQLQRYLGSLAGEIERPPQDAALSLQAGKVLPTASADGRQILADATALDIIAALQQLQPGTVAIRTRMLAPRMGNDTITQAVADAQALLRQPLTLRQGERSWTWDAEKIAQVLSTRTVSGTMQVGPDPQKLSRAVDDLAQVLDSGSAEPRVAFSGGKLRIAEEGTTGWRLRQPEAVQAISQTLWLAQRTVDLPVEELRPQVTAATLPSLGIVELVGEGRSSFAGSAAYRIQNIKAGAARMDGVLIPPDAEFSFNTQLGEVDEAHGFVEGYAVIGNRTQLEWGGGVCQDSTTLFRAAFWAGLPITERHAHPFYISWYDDYAFPDAAGPGMDAAIYTGVSDMKFVNDTGHWLLLDAQVDEKNAVLAMRLYGTKPDRTVAAIGPEISNVMEPPSEPRVINDASLPSGTYKQTDTARRGMDIAVYRVITERGEQREPEPFYTRFKAWPNVFVRGTGQ